jgi:hypothetical protein
LYPVSLSSYSLLLLDKFRYHYRLATPCIKVSQTFSDCTAILLTASSYNKMDALKEKPGGDALNGHSGEDYTPLGETILDRYGRRSRAWRHNTSGEMTTETALSEATTTYKPQLNFFRRQDIMNCLTISVLEVSGTRSSRRLWAFCSFLSW